MEVHCSSSAPLVLYLRVCSECTRALHKNLKLPSGAQKAPGKDGKEAGDFLQTSEQAMPSFDPEPHRCRRFQISHSGRLQSGSSLLC